MDISKSDSGVTRVLKSRTAVAIVTAIITASVVGGVAWAAQSPIDNAGVIHGCYNPSTGVVKLRVNPACPVKGATTPISWNQQGVQGIAGPAGPPGPEGPPGPAASVMFRAEKTSDQLWVNGPFKAPDPYPAVFVPVSFPQESFDTNGAYDPTTSSFVAPSSGYYEFHVQVAVNTNDQSGTFELVLAVNDSMHGRIDRRDVLNKTDNATILNGSSVVPLAEGDVVTVWVWSSTASGRFLRNGGVGLPEGVYDYRNTSFSGYRIAV